MEPTRAVEKRVASNRIHEFDYSEWEEILAGETIVSATVTITVGNGALAMGGVVISDPVVQVRLSAGTAGVEYTLECLATTSGGDILPMQGILPVVA